MSALEVVVALVILVGLVGVVVPVLPGSLLVLGAVLVWALQLGTSTGWIVFAVATTFIAVGGVVKYLMPGRRLKEGGVPTSTLLIGGALGIIGFFVVPVIGLPIGFVLGVYLAEIGRVGRVAAWPSTKHALRAVGLSMMIELASVLLAALTWSIGVAVT